MRRAWLVLLAACYHSNSLAPCETACSADNPICPDGQTCGSDLRCHGIDTDRCQAVADAPASPDSLPADAMLPCFARGLPDFQPVCVNPVLTVQSTVLTGELDTDGSMCTTHAQLHAGEPDACAIVAHEITVESLHPFGSRPLVLVALDVLTIMDKGVLDVGSTPDRLGAASGTVACAQLAAPSGTCAGYAGGSFGGQGGPGGASVAGAAQSPGTTTAPDGLRGGCASSRTGETQSSLHDGMPGGALYLVAGTDLQILGDVLAGGAGGSPGLSSGAFGAGGGGSGGMIVLEAPMIEVLGTVIADGGGGGGGASSAGTGKVGGSSLGRTQAKGGSGATGGGSGGGGSTGGTGDPGATSSSACGGGGGGGTGVIYIYMTSQDEPLLPQFSPTPTVHHI